MADFPNSTNANAVVHNVDTTPWPVTEALLNQATTRWLILFSTLGALMVDPTIFANLLLHPYVTGLIIDGVYLDIAVFDSFKALIFSGSISFLRVHTIRSLSFLGEHSYRKFLHALAAKECSLIGVHLQVTRGFVCELKEVLQRARWAIFEAELTADCRASTVSDLVQSFFSNHKIGNPSGRDALSKYLLDNVVPFSIIGKAVSNFLQGKIDEALTRNKNEDEVKAFRTMMRIRARNDRMQQLQAVEETGEGKFTRKRKRLLCAADVDPNAP